LEDSSSTSDELDEEKSYNGDGDQWLGDSASDELTNNE